MKMYLNMSTAAILTKKRWSECFFENLCLYDIFDGKRSNEIRFYTREVEEKSKNGKKKMKEKKEKEWLRKKKIKKRTKKVKS